MDPALVADLPTTSSPAELSVTDILSVSWNQAAWTLDIDVGWPIALAIVLVVVLTVGFHLFSLFRRGDSMEIDQAEIGVGENKLSFRPNMTDRQVAYAIWVELSTRKIGLPIDLEDDVIIEIYDSWYSYFSVTRDLIKTISVSKVRGKSTRHIINLSINVLNSGLRPHLTKWQARYRHWYDKQVGKVDQSSNDQVVLDPQLIQQGFPKYNELSVEIIEVNERLISYRKAMQTLVFDLK